MRECLRYLWRRGKVDLVFTMLCMGFTPIGFLLYSLTKEPGLGLFAVCCFTTAMTNVTSWRIDLLRARIDELDAELDRRK